MGLKGAIRSIGAAVRAAERDAKRRQRELEIQRKQYEKMQELEKAEYEVEVFENHIEVIKSIHKECGAPLNWHEVVLTEKPKNPLKKSYYETEAKDNLDKYKPGLFARFFNKGDNQKNLLLKEVSLSVKKDQEIYDNEIESWKVKVEEWKRNLEIGKALLNGDALVKVELIESFQPFTEISNLGSNISISVHSNGILEATINVHGIEIVPSKSKSLLKSGKLSVKNMPKGLFNKIYQDYVCSSILRVGNEIFSLIPDQLVIVTAVDDLLNSQTGHLEEMPIISVVLSCTTMKSLNLKAIDPSDSMVNFKHNMKFKKTKGFEAVERVNPYELDHSLLYRRMKN